MCKTIKRAASQARQLEASRVDTWTTATHLGGGAAKGWLQEGRHLRRDSLSQIALQVAIPERRQRVRHGHECAEFSRADRVHEHGRRVG